MILPDQINKPKCFIWVLIVKEIWFIFEILFLSVFLKFFDQFCHAFQPGLISDILVKDEVFKADFLNPNEVLFIGR